MSIDVICFFLRKIAAAVKARKQARKCENEIQVLGGPGTGRNVNQWRSINYLK